VQGTAVLSVTAQAKGSAENLHDSGTQKFTPDFRTVGSGLFMQHSLRSRLIGGSYESLPALEFFCHAGKTAASKELFLWKSMFSLKIIA
jgi:hypothetical protein